MPEEYRTTRRLRPVRKVRNRRRRRARLIQAVLALVGLMVGGAVTASLAFMVQVEESAAEKPVIRTVPVRMAAADDNQARRQNQEIPPVRVSRRKIYGDIETVRMRRPALAGRLDRAAYKFEFLSPDDEPERRARPGEGTPSVPVTTAAPRHMVKLKPPPAAPAAAPGLVKAPDAHNHRAAQLPWQRYAAASPANTDAPMIAVVLDDVGLSQYRADKVLALRRPLTVAILPYGHGLAALSARARAAGHEVLVHLPMEPRSRDFDPGPNALMVGLGRDELHRRLLRNLEQFGSYVGVSNHMGSRFTSSQEAMNLVMRVVKKRGLLFLDSVTSEQSVGLRTALRMGVPAASRDIFIDAEQDRAFIRRQLAAAERIAKKTGFVVAIGHPYPETLDELAKWLPGLRNKGFIQVPISAIVRRKRTG